jgi:putative DNA methylase
MKRWADESLDRASSDSFGFFARIAKDADRLSAPNVLRDALLHFIADFSDWENSVDQAYLSMAGELAEAGRKTLSLDDTRPVVLDPFAGGGAIPFEAIRLGADVIASDLNPVAALINKVVVEYAPRYRERLTQLAETEGAQLLERTRARLSAYYPREDGWEPIVFLWARTLRCQGPECGALIPLLTQLTITKRAEPPVAAFLTVTPSETRVDVREVRAGEVVPEATVRDAHVVCPNPDCGHTLDPEGYRRLSTAGGLGELLYGVVLRDKDGQRSYRTATEADRQAFALAASQAEYLEAEAKAIGSDRSPFPDETISEDEPRRLNIRQYGFHDWGQLFNSRQKYAIATFGDELQTTRARLQSAGIPEPLADAVVTVLGLAISNVTHYLTSVSTYLSDGMVSAFIQGSAIPMRADYAEANPLMGKLVGGFEYQLGMTVKTLERMTLNPGAPGLALRAEAQNLPLPDRSVDLIVTDPPYYFAIPYADLSDMFHVWLKRLLGDVHPELREMETTPKAAEATQSLPHSESPSIKNKQHFEDTMEACLREARRVLQPDGVAVLVFAHASAEGWESLIRALIRADWIVTASWPIETERAGRMLANRQSVLASSVHLVCRPRSREWGVGEDVGDWRSVLAEMPRRVREWMPRLAGEGIVGADAIFACLGPALEVFSRYERVEKASGETVSLEEFLEHVWAAVGSEALALVFSGADAEGFEADARVTAIWLWTLQASAESGEGARSPSAYTLEYDSARKIAQGLGANLEDLPNLVRARGNIAQLLGIRDRERHLLAQPENEESSLLGDELGFKLGETVLERLHQTMLLYGAGEGEKLRSLLVDRGIRDDAAVWRLAQALSALYPVASLEKRWLDGVLARKRALES